MFFKRNKMGATEEKSSKILRVYVRIGDREAEISYPLTPRNVVVYHDSESALNSAVSAITDLIEKLKE